MSSVGKKVDSSIRSKYRDYLRSQEGGRREGVDDRLHVSLQFTGPLEVIEALGFRTFWRDPKRPRATGTIRFADLERIAGHAGVVQLSYGSEPEPALDVSIPDIRANEVWSVAEDGFDGDATGQGVVVGIIDTGIDWRHEYFMGRILRIWDPGLVPTSGEQPPEASVLTGEGGRYGVEYRRPAIMAAIGGVGEVRHRDCSGHGTHVASIAAGNGGTKRKYIGVAPEADLIVVKHLNLQNEPRINNDSSEDKVGPGVRFRDAVTYILETARQDLANRPVVINCSFSRNIGPHDGLTDDEDFLTDLFDGATGACLVNSAGNYGGKKNHARLILTAGEAVEIPIDLYDDRASKLQYDKCAWLNLTAELKIELYYDAGPDPIEVEIDLPVDGTDFFDGPERDGPGMDPREFAGGQIAELDHDLTEQELSHTGRGQVRRSEFRLTIKPDSETKEHLLDTYRIRVTSPVDREAHLWCQQSRRYGLRIDNSELSSTVVDMTDGFQIGDNGGADHIITVASYDAEDEDGVDPVAEGSSRGPLASYDSAFTPPPKPDLAAPGESIDAAHSREVRPKQKKVETVQKGGTSMAAPHVAGVVALMLQRNSTLTTAQIITKLKTDGVRPVPATQSNRLGTGRLDARRAVDAAVAP